MRSPKPRSVLKVGSDPPLPSLKCTVCVNRAIDRPLIRSASSVSNFESKRVDALRSPQTPKINNVLQSRHLPVIGVPPSNDDLYSDPTLPSLKCTVGVNRAIDHPLIRSASSVSNFESKRVDALRSPQTPKINNVLQSRHLPVIGVPPSNDDLYSDPTLPSLKCTVGVNRAIDHPLIRSASSVSNFESKRVDALRSPQTPKINNVLQSRHLPVIGGDPPKQTKHFHQGSSSSAPAQKIVFCNICMTSKPFNKFFAIEGCKHSYCSRCLGSYIESKINANMTKIKCPDATCKDGKLEPLACKTMITKKVFDHWCDALCESTVGERFYCPFKDCSALLMDERGQEVMQESECPHCHRLFCAHCRVPWHTGLSCGKFQEMSQLGKEKKQESMLLELAKKSRWQRCPVCKFYVEKVSGCMFIKCRCGAIFCYGCASAMEVDHYCAKCKR